MNLVRVYKNLIRIKESDYGATGNFNCGNRTGLWHKKDLVRKRNLIMV